MSDLYGTLFISNNKATYSKQLQQYVYQRKFAGNQTIKVICNDDFKRGDVLRIININEVDQKIYCDKVSESYPPQRLPLMLILVMPIPVGDEGKYEFEFSEGVAKVLQCEGSSNENKYFCFVVLTKYEFSYLRGKELNGGGAFEWIMALDSALSDEGVAK